MRTRFASIVTAGFLLLPLPLLGCGGTSDSMDADATSDSDSDSDSDSESTETSGAETTTTGSFDDGDDAGAGAECDWHYDCESAYCDKWEDLVLGTCETAPEYGTMIVQGTMVDFITRDPVEGVEIKLASAVGAAANPVAAKSLGMGVSEADGRFSITTEEANGTVLGIVTVNTITDYYLTVSIVAGPIAESNNYLGGPDAWNQYVMPEATLAEWNSMLESDSSITSLLPLGGPEGGVVGRVWDVDNDVPMPGATLISEDADTQAHVRYLAEDMLSFNSEMTSGNGFFIVVNPGLGEEFDVMVGPDRIGSATVGAAANALVAAVVG